MNPVKRHAIFERFQSANPEPRGELEYATPFELLVAVILSAQATDRSVNLATRALFARARTPQAIAALGVEGLTPFISSIGLFRAKAKHIVAACERLLDNHGGEVPRTMDKLRRVPGAGRKTANVVLGNAYGIAEGIAVDTHASRLSLRLGLTDTVEPVKAERELVAIVPQRMWTDWTHLLIAHGRAVCTSRTAHCEACVLFDLCPTGLQERRRSARPARAPGH